MKKLEWKWKMLPLQITKINLSWSSKITKTELKKKNTEIFTKLIQITKAQQNYIKKGKLKI